MIDTQPGDQVVPDLLLKPASLRFAGRRGPGCHTPISIAITHIRAREAMTTPVANPARNQRKPLITSPSVVAFAATPRHIPANTPSADTLSAPQIETQISASAVPCHTPGRSLSHIALPIPHGEYCQGVPREADHQLLDRPRPALSRGPGSCCQRSRTPFLSCAIPCRKTGNTSSALSRKTTV